MAVSSRSAQVTLPRDDQIQIVREFDAPAQLVYRAMTTPELVRRWWHARRGEMTACEIDLQVGGTWRYAMDTPDGFEVAFHGEFVEIVPDELIVRTAIFEGVPPEVSEADALTIETAALSEIGARTILTLLIQASNQTSRDAIIASGMENGLQDALDLLEEVARPQ